VPGFRRTKRLALALAWLVPIALVASPESARALGPVDIEATARGGVGTNPSSKPGFANPLMAAIGGRLGVSYFGAYAGVSLDYYVGASGTIYAVGSGSGTVGGSTRTIMFGAELGYGIQPIRLLTIRPQLGLGNADRQLEVVGVGYLSNPVLPGDTNYFYVEPGLVGLLSFGAFLVGADVNLLLFPTASDWSAASVVHAQAGVKF
jgi:hypothetical protein